MQTKELRPSHDGSRDATKKEKKGKHKEETVDGVRVGNRVSGVVFKYHVKEIQQVCA